MTVKWTEVYHKLALALKEIQKETKNIGREIYRQLDEDVYFLMDNGWFLKYYNGDEKSIDPVVLFSSLNAPKLTDENRRKRIIHLCRIFLNNSFIDDDIDFNGCPTPLTLNLMRIRPLASQNVLWGMFSNALKHGINGLNEDAFLKLKEIRGIDIVSFTIFLFWIDANRFLPLDKNTVGYLIRTEKIIRIPKTYGEYFNLIHSNHQYSFLEISILGYSSSPERDMYVRQHLDIENTSGTVLPIEEPQTSKGSRFRIVAIKILDHTDRKLQKVLEKDKIYNFYKAYDFNDTDSVKYDPSLDFSIYDNENLQISISAIVGKNGTGKSTITELLYLAINCLTKQHGQISTNLENVSNFNFELYFSADFFYCIRFVGGQLTILRYEATPKGFSDPKQLPLDQFDFNQFFYTIAVNYSLYGLNSENMGSWITHLFHKNDSYQVPIVINPYRKRGVVNINSESELMKQRLLFSLLLQTSDQEDGLNLRKLTEKASAKKVSFKFDKSKFSFLYQIKENDIVLTTFKFSQAVHYSKGVLESICKHFKIDKNLIPVELSDPKNEIEYAFAYLLKKLISISRTYSQWSKYFNASDNIFSEQYDEFIERLATNYSHITYKFRQTVNFINNFDNWKKRLSLNDTWSDKIPIEILSDEVAVCLSKSNDASETIHMQPPPFLSFKIEMDDESDFEDLSSGEKQRIYVINSLIYHLYNINSVAVQDDLVTYRYVNVIFDEIELYFHPEMQQGFIEYMLSYIKRIAFDRIIAINILIITHSPFILSDIPNPNILFLGPVEPEIKTYGSNIHDLLANSFFMDGFMGDHVKKVIKDLLEYLKKDGKAQLNWSPESAKNLINVIGEPLIKTRLKEMYLTNFKPAIDKEKRRKELLAELKQLDETDTL